MKTSKLKKSIAMAASACVLTGVLATGASAATVTADYSVGANAYTKIETSSQGRMSVLAAQFKMETTAGESFLAYCLDLAHHIADGVAYKVTTLADGWFSDTAVKDIDRLFTSHYASLGSDNTRNAGFQLALWEIVEESSGNSYDLSSGAFSVSSSAAAQGQSFLDNLGSATGGYKLTFLDSDTNQSLVSADFSTNVAPVPVPAGLPLLLTGLGGIALIRRKRSKA